MEEQKVDRYLFPTFLFDRENTKKTTIIVGKKITNTTYEYNTIIFEDSQKTVKVVEASKKESIVTSDTIMSVLDKITDEMLLSYFFISVIELSMFAKPDMKQMVLNILKNKDETIQKYVNLLKINEEILAKSQMGYVYTEEHLEEVFALAKMLYIYFILPFRPIKEEIVSMRLTIEN